MIKVKRTTAPAILSSEAAERERKLAQEHYDKKANLKKEFKFKIYGDRSVRDALEVMFRRKCAYCEVKIGAGDESEIEHWRPKGAVKEDDGTRSFPAYHWLASRWDNLLLSCIKCNRPRKYRKMGSEEEEEDEVWERSGKGMLFPLSAGDVRATTEGAERSEHPLLLDPCKDDPQTYLEFVLLDDEPKRKALVRPKGTRGRRRERAERSISVYSLNRDLLVDARRRELLELQNHLASFKLALETFNQLPDGELREKQAELMQRSVASIAERLKPDAPFLLMTSQAIADFLRLYPVVRPPLEHALRAAP
jgi:uncharacterized protein (TIGR02646 family)